MLNIGYLIICDDVIKEPNHTLLKPAPVLVPINLPSNYSFKVAFSLYNLEEENFHKDNDIRIVFKSPSKIIADTGILKLSTNKQNKPKDAKMESIEADVSFNNVELADEGVYELTLTVNENKKQIEVPVIKKSLKGDSIDKS